MSERGAPTHGQDRRLRLDCASMNQFDNAVRVRILAATGNAAFAEKIAIALEAQGYEIAEGDFDPKDMDAAIVIWSGASIGSPEMVKAAALPLAYGALIAVSIGRVEPPQAFRHIPPIDLAGWSGDGDDARWRAVLDEVDRAAYAARLPPGAPNLDPPAAVRPPPEQTSGSSRFYIAASFAAAAVLVFGGFLLLSDRAPRADRAPAASNNPVTDESSADAGAPPMLAVAAQAAKDEAPPAAPSAGAPVADKIAALIQDAQETKAHPDENRSASPPAPAASPDAPGAVFKDCPECPDMTVIPAGSFLFGSPSDEPARQADEGPVRKVDIAKPFALATHETTYDEWDACVADGGCSKDAGADPGWGRGRRPVVNVSWRDAMDYVAWLSKKTGKTYRLPTEEEWEYAARAGAKTPFSFGVIIRADQANFDASHPYGGEAGAGRKQTLPVGSFPKNPFGLYDMAGNVWEWTADCWSEDHNSAPADGDAIGGKCDRRVLKGGAWNTGGWRLRAGHRIPKSASAREFDNGFRVARDLD